jgi:hypothetical protein
MIKVRSEKKTYTSISRYLYITTIFSYFLLTSCNNSGEKIPDVSNIKVSLQTWRFDKDLYSIDTNHIADGLKKLLTEYPDFLNYYLDTIREYGIYGNYNDTVKGIREDLRTDLTFKDFRGLEDTIFKYYPDSKETDATLTDGFKYMKYYMPDYAVPRIIYLNMGLSKWPTFPIDNTTFCIGLDMFLGDQFPYYKSVGIPAYMAAHLRKSYLPVSLFTTIYRTIHPFNTDDQTLLSLMVQRGKEQYFLHKILPHTPDTVLFGFTTIQLKWCGENEAMIYNFFIHQNLLYNKEGHNIIPYVNDGPFAKDLEAPSDTVKTTPGNIGSWLGYRIVSAYMARHPEINLQTLLNQETDPAKLLDEAKYRPK